MSVEPARPPVSIDCWSEARTSEAVFLSLVLLVGFFCSKVCSSFATACMVFCSYIEQWHVRDGVHVKTQREEARRVLKQMRMQERLAAREEARKRGSKSMKHQKNQDHL